MEKREEVKRKVRKKKRQGKIQIGENGKGQVGIVRYKGGIERDKWRNRKRRENKMRQGKISRDKKRMESERVELERDSER